MKNRKLVLILSMVLAMTMSLGGTLTYLSDTDADVNTMVLGNVDIAQNEQQRVEIGNAAAGLEDFEDDQVMLPAVYDVSGHQDPARETVVVNGYEITVGGGMRTFPNYMDKIVSVTNTGKSNAYVRTIIAVPAGINEDDSDGDVSEQWLHVNVVSDSDTSPANGWYYGKSESVGEYPADLADHYVVKNVDLFENGKLYDIIVATNKNSLPKDATTGPNLVGLYLDNDVNYKNDAYYAKDMRAEGTKQGATMKVWEGTDLKVYVLSQAVQTAGFDDAWTALSDAFGDVTADKAKEWFKGFAGESETPEVNTPTNMVIKVQPVNGLVPYAVQFNDPANGVSATVPAGAKMADGATSLKLVVEAKKKSEADVNLTRQDELFAYNVKVEGLAADNTVPVIINMGEVLPVGLNLGNYDLYHVEDGKTVSMTRVAGAPVNHNEFTYNPATGEVTVALATFSEVAAVADTVNAWNGTVATAFSGGSGTKADPYIVANADELAYLGKLVAEGNSFTGQTFNLIANVNMGGDTFEKGNNPELMFYPIGVALNDGSVSINSFEGTFDGQGHTIGNIYQNTWMLVGDYDGTYYNDAMGLFGYVYNGTIKNLTVDNFSSDGEFTPTGVIAAYADGDSTFENIAITNCNPRVYNTGNGGIIGIAGSTGTEDDSDIVLKNITVDNSNKISALWGSWDVACGGLVGMYRGNVDSNGAATGDTISFTNCHVAAQIDVYNDVCANYQYYAYRYAGMIIGSVRHNTTNDDGKTIPNMAGISATGCTVNYGDWNDYYYCEFEKNSMASYSEDYQFSRIPHSELNFTDSNGNGVVDADERDSVTGCKHTHTEAEKNNMAVYLPFHQLFTGYSWGVSSIGLETYKGIMTDSTIEEDPNHNTSVYKFEQAATASKEYAVGDTVTIGKLFTAIPESELEVPLDPDNVQVFVSPVGNDSTAGGTYKPNTTDWKQGTLTFTGAGAATITITDYYYCKETTLSITVAEPVSVEKFDLVFENTDDYLYRVGNANTVALGSLFKAKDGAEIGNVTVTVTALNGATVSGTYKANTTDWTNGTIKFSNTGVVKVTITDNDYCIPTELYLEVVDAKNVTKAESATSNNVVLLNDVFDSFSVSGDHTLYGNGFTVTLPTSSVVNKGSGFVGYVNLGSATDGTGGNLDNVKIVGPVYPEQYIYRSQAEITDSSDPDYGDGYNMRYFHNSVITLGGNCTISNSYISGSRAALYVKSGNHITVDNTTLSGGSYVNMQIAGAVKVTLKDLTTVQTPVVDSYGNNKEMMGMGVAVSNNIVEIVIEDDLNQYNWVSQADAASYIPSDYKSTFDKFYTDTTYKNFWHYRDGDTSTKYLNFAFVFTCDADFNKVSGYPSNYESQSISIPTVGEGGVLATANAGTLTDAMYIAPDYQSPGFNPVAPLFVFDNTNNADENDENDASDSYCVYDAATGTLRLGLTGDSKTIDLSDVSITESGNPLTYTAYLNDGKISGSSVTISVDNGTKQTLMFKASGNAGYDKVGNAIEGEIEYTWTVTVEVATLSYPAPVWNMNGTYKFEGTSNIVYTYKDTFGGYVESVPIYNGIKVIYYNANGTKIEKDFSSITTAPTVKTDDAKTFIYTLDDKSTLSMTLTVTSWKGGPTAFYFTTYSSLLYIYPQGVGNDSYRRASVTGQDFNVTITYTFTDPNGQSVGPQAVQWYNAKASNSSVTTVQWKKFDSTNGESGSCVTPDTLVTLADGSKKEIQHVKVGDEVLAWNFYTGAYEVMPVSLLQAHDTGMQDVLHLTFDDGTVLKVLGEHGIFDVEKKSFIFIDKDDVTEYVGRTFLKQDGSGFKQVKLVDYKVVNEYTTAYTILSADHYNVLLEDMLTVTPAHVGDNFFNPFEIGEDMKYDDAKVQADIEKYGLYTYEDFAHVLTETQFEALNMGHFKVSVGKGLITYDGLIYLIENFINGDF